MYPPDRFEMFSFHHSWFQSFDKDIMPALIASKIYPGYNSGDKIACYFKVNISDLSSVFGITEEEFQTHLNTLVDLHILYKAFSKSERSNIYSFWEHASAADYDRCVLARRKSRG